MVLFHQVCFSSVFCLTELFTCVLSEDNFDLLYINILHSY